MVECLWAFHHVGFFCCEVFKPASQRKPLKQSSATNWPQVVGTIGGDLQHKLEMPWHMRQPR